MNNRGQTLIEVVTSLGLILIVVTALIGLGVVALKTSSSSRNRTVAAKLAGQGMELVRAYRDSAGFTNLEGYVAPCTSPNKCYTDGSTITTGGSELFNASGVSFERWFNLTSVAAGKLRVTEAVQWTESGGTKSVTVASFLTNWQ